MGRLDGKIILVTGGNRGIGLAIAQVCGREGAQLVIAARDPRALRAAAKRIPGGALAISADVTRHTSVERLFRRVKERFGRLDVLVNNAGVFTFKPFVKTTLEDWRKNIETNFTSVFLATRAALPLFARSRAPQLVNILSISSLHGFPKCSAYSASKFGALGLTRVLQEELRELRIRVTAVIPGPTDTRMPDEFDFPFDRAKLVQPGDVAEAVLGALVQPERTTTQQIVIMPSAGKL
ncbi:MAG TPA: SDR family oxidoreductase [Terriglobia bacterium]|nr:SDR family oxidoreductase [Terriglobia bacterium]